MARKRGFRKIPNPLFDSLMRAKLPGAGYAVVLAIIDATLGYQRETSDISLTRFQTLTGLSRMGVVKAIQSLESRKIVTLTRNGTKKTVYGLEDIESWLPASKQPLTSELVNARLPDWYTPVYQTSKQPMPATPALKKTLKKTLKKESLKKKDNDIKNIFPDRDKVVLTVTTPTSPNPNGKSNCLKCGFEWHPRVAHPKACPLCKSTTWFKPKSPDKRGRPRTRDWGKYRWNGRGELVPR